MDFKDYNLLLKQEFVESKLDLAVWIPYYLPHWSSKEKTKARYSLKDGKLDLQIEFDQEPWSKEFNGEIRVSSLQTGLYSGPLNSHIGQHCVHPDCKVMEEQKPQKNFLSQYGYYEIRAKASPAPSNVSALWMIGYEEAPNESAEICIVEIKGDRVERNMALIGYGIRKFQDPLLEDRFFEEIFELDVTEFHTYAAEWTPEHINFFIDGKKIRTINQSPKYPMQLMLNLYEIPNENYRRISDYPQTFSVDYIKVYQKKISEE